MTALTSDLTGSEARYALLGEDDLAPAPALGRRPADAKALVAQLA